MSKLKGKFWAIWCVIKNKDWVMFRYDVSSQTAYPFDLYLPGGYNAHYTEQGVTITKAASLSGENMA